MRRRPGGMACVALLLLVAGFSGCSAPKGEVRGAVTVGVGREITAGQKAQSAGRLEEAQIRYAEALRSARGLADVRGSGLALYHLGLLMGARGGHADALPLLQESLLALQSQDAPVAAVKVARAELGMRVGAAEAAGWIDEALAAATRERQPALAVQARLMKVKAALAAGLPVVARDALADAAAGLKGLDDSLLQARYALLEGELALVDKSPRRAAEAFGRGAEGYRIAMEAAGVAAALQRAGMAWSVAGDVGLAADAFLGAAQSLEAQGRRAEAEAVLRELLALEGLEAGSAPALGARQLLERWQREAAAQAVPEKVQH